MLLVECESDQEEKPKKRKNEREWNVNDELEINEHWEVCFWWLCCATAIHDDDGQTMPQLMLGRDEDDGGGVKKNSFSIRLESRLKWNYGAIWRGICIIFITGGHLAGAKPSGYNVE